jgi:hypothetical protein
MVRIESVAELEILRQADSSVRVSEEQGAEHDRLRKGSAFYDSHLV